MLATMGLDPTSVKYDTYQDVKNTLFLWSFPLWFMFLFVVWNVVLSASSRATIAGWLPGVGKYAFIVGGGVILAVVTTHIFEIHDHWYDRYIVRWRKNYDTSFIIPLLLQPFEKELPENVLNIATQNRREFLRLAFYHFVADRDTKIEKNLLVRFYERVTKYWLSQLVEVASLGMIALSAVCGLVLDRRVLLAFPNRYLWLWIVCGAIVGVCRLVASALQSTLREATKDEIDAIQTKFPQQLKNQVKLFLQRNEKEHPSAGDSPGV